MNTFGNRSIVCICLLPFVGEQNVFINRGELKTFQKITSANFMEIDS